MGGNELAEWVTANGGQRVIRKILIANNGCARPSRVASRTAPRCGTP